MQNLGILTFLEKWTVETPDNLLYSFLNRSGDVVESYTYQQFHERTNYVARYLSNTGLVHFNEPVILNYQPGIEIAIAFFACIKLGALPVPVQTVDSTSSLKKLIYIIGDSGAKTVLTDQYGMRKLDRLLDPKTTANLENQASLHWLQPEVIQAFNWISTDSIKGELSEFSIRVNDLLFLQYTSGSTQDPRGVVVSHRTVINNCTATLDHQPIGVFWLPHYHDMGLIGYYLFIGILGGSSYGFSAFNFLRRPTLWLDAISRFSATITSAPNFAFEYCLREYKVPSDRIKTINLSSLRSMMNASEPVRASTLQKFFARFAPYGLKADALHVYYGLAENTLSVSSKGRTQVTVNRKLLERNQLRIEPAASKSRNQLTIVSCGQPLPGVDMKIVDPETRRLQGEDRVGEIWVTGSSKAEGYWNKPTLTQQTFRAQIQGDSAQTHYLRTGDLGFIHDGELFVCSRIKEMIIIGGCNYFPADIEAVVEEASSQIRQGCVAAFSTPDPNGSECVVVIAEINKRDSRPDLQTISQAISQYCHIDIKELVIVTHGNLARTSSGKIARHKCQKLWQQGQLDIIDRWVQERPSEAESPIQNLLSRLDIQRCKDYTLAQLGLDSLTLVSLSLYIESLLNHQGQLDRDTFFEQILDLRLLQAITLDELRTLEQQLQSNRKLASLSSPLLLKKMEAISHQEQELMRQDIQLAAEIKVDNTCVPKKTNKILLTGATGFLGAFILEALLRLTEFDITVIVRAENAKHAHHRVEAALKRTDLWSDDLDRSFQLRVKVLNGDISKSQLGLSAANWNSLATDLSKIYHCGAEVDYVKSYQALRATNTMGTLEILRLASCNRIKELHFVSTTFIFGFSNLPILWEDDSNVEMNGLNFGYSQSKWVAEQLVHIAAQNGLPIKVYRPSLITASTTGRFVRRDITARVLAYMIQYGISVNSANQMSFLPVDVCANNIVAMSLSTDPFTTVHLTANDYYTMQTVCSLINKNHGYPFEYVNMEKFVRHINQYCQESDPLFPLIPFFNKNQKRIDDMSQKRYDNQNYRYSQSHTPLMYPEPPLEKTVDSIVSFLKSDNLI